MTENIFCKVKVNNVPEDRAMKHGFMVVRRSEDGSLWFYGIYPLDFRAEEVAKEIGNGLVLEV